MIGGGFLGQGNKSAQDNRQTLRDAIGRTPKATNFQKKGESGVQQAKELSPAEREELINKIRNEDAGDLRRKTIKWIVILGAIIIALILSIFL